ncbi:MAG: caspase family protein [Saprospiraceae bacterium]|nr:caspase family protein [Saprospiraceae bacterium]
MPSQAPSHLHALLIAINNYPIPRHRLNGCVADRDALKGYLEKRFTTDTPTRLRLKTLTDREATKQAVIESFSHFDAAQDGDVCLLYFSGHGSQAPAPPEFWHLDPSRMNQSLVCFDSRVGGKDLMDKEMSYLLWKATQGKNIHFIAVFDCCHSGTITRELAATPRMAETSPVPSKLEDYHGYQDYNKTTENGKLQLSPPRGRYVQLAAAKDKETAKELKIGAQTRGIFTYNLVALLEQAADQMSYEDLVSSLRLRIEGKVREQTPQLISTEPTDQKLRFLGGAAPAQSPYFNVVFSQGRWVLDAGALQGVPANGGVVTIEDGAQIKITQVDQNRSEVSGMEGKDATKTYKVSSSQFVLPKLLVALDPDGEKEGLSLMQQAFRSLASPLLSLTTDIDAATYWIRATEKSYRLTLPCEERPLFRRVEGYSSDNAEIFLGDLEKVARWRNLLDLTNPRTTISNDDFSIHLYRSQQPGYLEDDVKVEEADWRNSPVFRYDFVNGKWEQPAFQLKVVNKSNRILYVSALNLEDNFTISNRFLAMQELPAGGEVWLTELYKNYNYRTIPLSVADAYHSWGATEKKEYFKIFISTAPQLNTDFYNQKGLELDFRKTEKNRAGRGEEPANPDIPDWLTREIALTVVRPMEQQTLSAGQVVTLLDKISIKPPAGLSAKIALTPRGEAERSLDTGANFSQLWGFQEAAEPYAMTRGFNEAPPLSVLELYDVEGASQVDADHPLTVGLQDKPADRELVIPLGYDPESGTYYPLGMSTPDGEVRIESLPEETPAGTRSLGGSIKIFFHKVVLSKLGYTYNHPQLAVADFSTKPEGEEQDEEAFSYLIEEAAVKSKVAAAEKIILFIHGIIGDTTVMPKSLLRIKDDNGQTALNRYDLVMTFDYENLNTPIEQTAKDLKTRLTAVGLGAGHGKHLTIVAHSMGGLVSRWMIEKEEGNKMVNYLVQVGTPNSGSPWADVYELASVLLARAVNGAAFLKPYLLPLSLLGKLANQLFLTLQQMDAEKSAFLKALNDGSDPGIPYAIVAGNTQLIPVAISEKQRLALIRALNRFRQRAHYNALDKMLFKLANDIAVSTNSIFEIPGKEQRKDVPTKLEVACDHISYFDDPAGLEGLGQVLAVST